MIIVLGSINIDLTTTTSEIPKPGETVIGESFAQYAGGKGANQAVCAAKLGAEVVFLGKVGNDAYGDFMLREMERAGVDVSRVERCDTHTGLAAISVDSSGRNCIIVVPGANFLVDIEYVERHSDAIERCDMILAQHETPVAATERAFQIAKAAKRTTLLNPAPAAPLSDEIIRLTDILVPNEHELARISGVNCKSIEDMAEAAHALREKGISRVLVTLGKDGVLFGDMLFPAFTADAVDTTAAGDCFMGGFAVAFAKNRDLAEAIQNGQIAASYSVRHKGAQSSMPDIEQFEAYKRSLLKEQV